MYVTVIWITDFFNVVTRFKKLWIDESISTKILLDLFVWSKHPIYKFSYVYTNSWVTFPWLCIQSSIPYSTTNKFVKPRLQLKRVQKSGEFHSIKFRITLGSFFKLIFNRLLCALCSLKFVQSYPNAEKHVLTRQSR